MKRSISFLLFLCITCSFLLAQTDPENKKDKEEKALQTETKGSSFIDLEEGKPIENQLNRFSRSYRFEEAKGDTYDTLLQNVRNYRSDDVPRFSPKYYEQKLYDLPTVIPMDYNQYVARYIEVYAVKRRDQVARMMGLGRVYFPIFEEYLDKENLPMELKYLPVVESALNPHARSRVGATGLWQFMLYTGKQYGLKVNSFVDERRDPTKATIAATKYLKDAYNEFGDWLLAIASYNCGIGNVRKAIRRSGGKRNFWEIRAWLPRETRGYVPAFIAATYVFEHSAEHNIYPVYVDFSLHQDTLHLNRLDITLNEISTLTGEDLNTLQIMNPELKLDRIPYTSDAYMLRATPKVANYFASNERSIREKYGKKRDQYIPKVASKSSSAASKYVNPQPPKGKTLVYYTVRTGDVVGSIAEKYHVSARQIAYWNNLYRYRIKVGQRLKIYSSKSVAEQAGARPAKRKTSGATASYSKNASYHTVRSGDTLWGISNRYNVSIESLKNLNSGIGRNLKIGQKVRIR
ncbi:MAG: transglycosylase SLT domain-containing protein [Bacteroidota bacterium]